MNEDPKKVELILKELNKGLSRDKWIWEDATYFHGLNKLTLNNGAFTLGNNEGIIVKVFINKVTGELKQYYWQNVATDQ